MENIVEKALEFAREAHASVNQVRKYTGEPYIVHPIEVREILLKFATGSVSIAQECAALLHDVVEDTPISLDQVYDAFGQETGDLVESLTDISKLNDGNRKVRKTMDLEHSAASSGDAQSVKCADLISNSYSIVQYDPDFARIYLHEKERLLNVLTNADSGLLTEAWRVLVESRAILSKKV